MDGEADRLPPSQRSTGWGGVACPRDCSKAGRPVAVTAASDQFIHHLGASAVANPPMAPDSRRSVLALSHINGRRSHINGPRC